MADRAHISPMVTLSVLVVIGLVQLGAVLMTAIPAIAQADLRDPREIALLDDEGGGKASYLTRDEEGTDERSRWIHRRWERDGETDQGIGPIITHNTVWVALDLEAAKWIFDEQSHKQREFPERIENADGPAPFPFVPRGHAMSALSACVKDRCEGSAVNIHHRVVVRKENVVASVYLFGRLRTTTKELTLYFIDMILERV